MMGKRVQLAALVFPYYLEEDQRKTQRLYVVGRRFVNIVGTVSIFAAFVVACVVLANVVGAASGHSAITIRLWQWIDLGGGTLRGDDRQTS